MEQMVQGKRRKCAIRCVRGIERVVGPVAVKRSMLPTRMTRALLHESLAAFIVSVPRCILGMLHRCLHAFDVPAKNETMRLKSRPAPHRVDGRRNSRYLILDDERDGRFSVREDAFRRPPVGGTSLGKPNTAFSQSHIRELPVDFTLPLLKPPTLG